MRFPPGTGTRCVGGPGRRHYGACYTLWQRWVGRRPLLSRTARSAVVRRWPSAHARTWGLLEFSRRCDGAAALCLANVTPLMPARRAQNAFKAAARLAALPLLRWLLRGCRGLEPRSRVLVTVLGPWALPLVPRVGPAVLTHSTLSPTAARVELGAHCLRGCRAGPIPCPQAPLLLGAHSDRGAERRGRGANLPSLPPCPPTPSQSLACSRLSLPCALHRHALGRRTDARTPPHPGGNAGGRGRRVCGGPRGADGPGAAGGAGGRHRRSVGRMGPPPPVHGLQQRGSVRGAAAARRGVDGAVVVRWVAVARWPTRRVHGRTRGRVVAGPGREAGGVTTAPPTPRVWAPP